MLHMKGFQNNSGSTYQGALNDTMYVETLLFWKSYVG